MHLCFWAVPVFRYESVSLHVNVLDDVRELWEIGIYISINMDPTNSVESI